MILAVGSERERTLHQRDAHLDNALVASVAAPVVTSQARFNLAPPPWEPGGGHRTSKGAVAGKKLLV